MFWQPTRGILQPNQHWRRGQVPGLTPVTAWNVPTTGGTNAGWGGYTIVLRLASTDWINTGLAAGKTQFRITTDLAAWTSGGTMKGYFGQRNAAGDNYDFAATPAQLLWGGSTTITSTGSNLINTSDFVNLPEAFDVTKDYCLALFFSSVATVTLNITAAGQIDGDVYDKIGDDAATVNKSGYALDNDTRSFGVSKVEVQ